MGKRRRWEMVSDWLLALKRARNAKRLRQQLPRHSGSDALQLKQTRPCREERDDRSPFSEYKDSSAQIPVRDSFEDTPDWTEHEYENYEECMGRFQPFTEDYLDLKPPPDPPVSPYGTSPSTQNTVDEHPCTSESEQSASEIQITNPAVNSHQTLRSEKPVDVEILRSMRQKWENRLTLAAMVSVVGSVRSSVDQYEFFRDILSDELPASGHHWPSYSKVHSYFQEVIRFCMPRSKLVDLPTKHYKNLDHVDGATQSVRIFLPSAWAKLDIATSQTFQMMYGHQQGDRWTEGGLEQSMTVQNREWITYACNQIMLPWLQDRVPCGPGSLMQISIKRRRFSFMTAYQMNTRDDAYAFKAKVVTTWCVGAADMPNPSFERATQREVLTNDQRVIVKALSSADPSQRYDEDNFCFVLPGDICTLLSVDRARNQAETAYQAILINRFWRYQDGTPSLFIVWLRAYDCNSDEGIIERGVEIIGYDVVLHTRLTKHMPPRSGNGKPKFRTFGKLEDGTPYYVYRILLYCDDFQQSVSGYNRGSVGGCYFLPLSYPAKARRSSSAVRIVSLTPPGVSTNEVLRYIMDDVVIAAVRGVDGTTPTSQKVKIFIDVVGFVGDYPAAASTLDVVGHVGRAPCTVCSFRRLHASEADKSRYGYTTDVHAGNTAYLRHAERHVSLRSSDITDEEGKALGIISRAKVAERTSPLTYLSEQLEAKADTIPLTSEGYPVHLGLFDPYRCNVIAPDHLLTGLCQDAINNVIGCLPSNEACLAADTMICGALRDNGLLRQSEVINMRKKKLHSMTLSELYCVLTVSCPCFKILTASYDPDHVVRQALSLLNLLSTLVALTYWWPQSEIDGMDAVEYVHGNREKYISDLKRKSKEYVRAVDSFCGQFPDHSDDLDKPNLHRLIELYEHSLPMFGHVREFMELVFESAHQPLKRCITKSNNHKAHIFATEHCVANDWLGRIAALSREMKSGDPSDKLGVRRSLRRLFMGEEADALRETQDEEFISETDRIIEQLCTRAVLKRFQREGRISNFAVDTQTTWKARRKISVAELSTALGLVPATGKAVVSLAKEWLEAVYPTFNTEKEDDITCTFNIFASAKRVKLTKDNRQIGKPSGFDVISLDCVVQARVMPEEENSRIVQTTDHPNANSFFFVVAAVLHRSGDPAISEPSWAICAKCNTYPGCKIMVERSLDIETFQLLCLTPDVRRVAVYHACQNNNLSNDCSIQIKEKRVEHSMTPLRGALMYFQTRREGYPPRQA